MKKIVALVAAVPLSAAAWVGLGATNASAAEPLTGCSGTAFTLIYYPVAESQYLPRSNGDGFVCQAIYPNPGGDIVVIDNTAPAARP